MVKLNNTYPKVAVLMTTFNSQLFIEEQIVSIFSQKNCKSISLFISDNGSCDDTVKIIKQLKKRYINIYIINDKKVGNTPAENFYYIFKNIVLDNFDIVSLSDHDDIFLENKFYSSYSQICNSKYVGMSSAVKCFGRSNKILTQSRRLSKYDFIFQGGGQGCTFIIKLNFFKKFQSFVINNFELISNFYYHDWLIYLFARSNNHQWFFEKNFYTLYRIHNFNNTGSRYSFAGVCFRVNKIFMWYYNQVIIASKIVQLINKDLSVNFSKLNVINLIYIILFHSRRNYFDRIILLFSFIPVSLLKKIKCL